jgi:hypothetical protein
MGLGTVACGGPGSVKIAISDADATLTGGDVEHRFGWSVSTAGDINNDGYSDIIVGAPYEMDTQGTDAGAAYVFMGSSSGIGDLSSSKADFRLSGASYHGFAGWSVATAGDVNGDTYDDIIVSAPNHVHWQTGGEVFIVHGSASGVADPSLAKADTILSDVYSDGLEYGFGLRVQTAGDINGDGFDDVIAGHPYSNSSSVNIYNYGFAYILYGSSTGIADGEIQTVADVKLSGEVAHMETGYSVATAGDVNGDGHADVVVGAPGGGKYKEGAAYMFLGSSSGISDMAMTSADTMLTGRNADDSAGSDAQTAGDVNGDGYDDVIMGAPGSDAFASDAGSAYIFLGSNTGISSAKVSTAHAVIQGETAGDGAGFRTRPAGDFDNDGFDDVLVSAHGYDSDTHTNAGAVYLIMGSSSGVADMNLSAANGKATGTGTDDELGWGLFTAGDVNGDGHSDILMGAYGNDDVADNAGAAYLFYGF